MLLNNKMLYDAIYVLKATSRNTRNKARSCPKPTIKTTEWRQFADFEQKNGPWELLKGLLGWIKQFAKGIESCQVAQWDQKPKIKRNRNINSSWQAKLLQNMMNKKLRQKVPMHLCFRNFTEIQQRHHKNCLKATLMAWKYQHSSITDNA